MNATRTFIITGGNAGLGYECAKNIARDSMENYVLLACRSPQRAGEAIKRLIGETGNPNVSMLALDLASLASVRAFVRDFAALPLPPLFALVCNAGCHGGEETAFTKDGFEMTFGVNHLGHFYLINLLLPLVAEGGRIVIVSSDTHDPRTKTGKPAPIYPGALKLAYASENDPRMTNSRRYSTSKLCNIYCCYELNERIQKTGRNVTVNAFNPGMMPGTALVRNYRGFTRFLWYHVAPILIYLKKSVHSVEDSGRKLARLALSPEVEGISGKYFDGADIISTSELSYNEANRKDLWQTSVELTGLKDSPL